MAAVECWGGLPGVFAHHARERPNASAVRDSRGEWTYAELWEHAGRAASVLQDRLFISLVGGGVSEGGLAPRPLAVATPRSREWYAVCVAAWQLGIPVVALSDDMSDRAAQQNRAERVAQELQPLALVISGALDSDVPVQLFEDCLVLQLDDLMALPHHALHQSALLACGAHSESILCYVFTGGTTRHSKCVAVSHAMALWEMEKYATALRHQVGEQDRMLQYSSAYWGAAVFGQLDLALAFGACAVIVRAPGLEELAKIVDEERITVLGVVPSQLRGAWPGGPRMKPSHLRVVISWAEKLPLHVAREWAPEVTMFELLIASEYWLTFHSNCDIWRDPADGAERLVHRSLPGLDMLLISEDGSVTAEGDAGELFLAGPTVFPGYVGPGRCIGAGPENDAAFRIIGGKRYYRTKDRLRRVPAAAGGGFVYCGRADALMKRGGAWVDLEALENAVLEIPGVRAAAVVQVEEALHAFVVLEAQPAEPFCRVLDRVSRALRNSCEIHVRAELPVHPATGKVDRRSLGEHERLVRSREAAFMESLSRQQKRMFFGYMMWDMFAAFLVTGPGLLLSLVTHWWSLGATLVNAARRLFLVPYLWVALLYFFAGPHNDPGIAGQRGARWAGQGASKLYKRSLGLPDILVVCAALVPRPEACAWLASAFVLWARDGTLSAASCLVVAVLGSLAIPFMTNEVIDLPPSVLALPFLIVSTHGRARLQFLAGLPISFVLAAPKWMRDDWCWRVDCPEAVLRRSVMRWLPMLQKKPFDGSWKWEESLANVDWGGEDVYPAVRISEARDGTSLRIGLWQDVVPAVVLSSERLDRDHVREGGCSFVSPEPQASVPLSPLGARLAALVARVGGQPPWLASLDSLKAIALVESVRRELSRVILVGDVLKCADVEELARRVQDATPCSEPFSSSSGSSGSSGSSSRSSSRPSSLAQPDLDGAYRVYMMRFPKAPVDWYIKFGGNQLDVHALQRAADALILRHSALRTVQTPDEPLREVMDIAAATWQLTASCFGRREAPAWAWLSQAVASALYACWPRTFLRSPEKARVQIRIPPGPRVREESWNATTDDDYAFWHGGQLRKRHRWPFDLFVIPIFQGEPLGVGPDPMTAADAAALLPPQEVSWYIFAGITHCYADGATGQALFRDLLKLYASEAGVALEGDGNVPPPPPEPLALLQQRLFRSLRGRVEGEVDANNDVYHEIACEDWGRRPGLQRRLYFQPEVLQLLQVAAKQVLGCSIDVAWLGAIVGTLFRLFPQRHRISIVLKCACRDGPGESQMVGFLSEQRVLTVDLGDLQQASLLDVVQRVDTARRSRDWRVPVPFEAGLCVYVNIVSAMLDGLPFSCHQVLAEANSYHTFNTDAYSQMNIRLDQRTELDWDFRIFHWDEAWTWEWSKYFAQVIGNCIADLASSPVAPVLRPVAPQAAVSTGSSSSSAQLRRNKRKGTSPTSADEGAGMENASALAKSARST